MKLKILTMFATFGVLFTVGCGDSTNPISTTPVAVGGETRTGVERFAYTANFTEGTVSVTVASCMPRILEVTMLLSTR